jgi:DNA-binding NtrC family response regulator
MKPKLLVVDDDEVGCRLVKAIFGASDVEVVSAHDAQSGLERVAADDPQVVLLDLRLPGVDGLKLLEMLKTTAPKLPVIIFTASRDVKTAVQAIQLGAFDYLIKPIDEEEIVVTVRRALETNALRREVEELRRHVGHDAPRSLRVQMGPSSHVGHLIEQVAAVATSNFTVLILGETGTGKELVAQAVHHQSDRHGKPFVALDCGAIPEPLLESELFGHEKGAFTGAERRKQGRLRLAEGGTCFLDEIGNLPMSLQAKLLRVLESRQVQAVGADHASPMDVRFIAATNDDLQARVVAGLFRADLYFRLAQYTISLPPLRKRTDDIPYLAQRFLEEASVELRRPIQAIVPDAVDVLRAHKWPGNVRELRNVIRQAILQSGDLVLRANTVQATLGRAADIKAPVGVRNAGPSGLSLREAAEHAARAAEHQAICDTLRLTGGNKAEAARLLKTDYKTLHVKIKLLGIRARDFVLDGATSVA